MKIEADELISYQESLSEDRSIWERTWQDIIDYTLPNRAPVIGEDSPGQDRSIDIYDSTASNSTVRLAAALNSMLTNPQSQWFLLETTNEALNKESEVKIWLDALTKVVRKQMDLSNFYSAIHELYLDLCSIGTGTLYMEQDADPDKELNFSARHIREIFVAENHQGRIDQVFRKFKMTARQMQQRWGNLISSDAQAAAISEPNSEYEILHCCFPREDANPTSALPEEARFASVWIEIDSRHIIREGGYRTFPYTVPRWFKSTGEKYGRSPALTVLGDIKSLNDMTKTMMRTGQKVADPPIMVPDDGFFNIDTDPGGISYYRSGTNDRIIPLDVGSRLPITFQQVQEKREQIADAYFTTQLQIIDKSRMTAEEVRARMNENMRILGPTIGRLQDEFLDMLITRVLDILRFSFDRMGQPILPIPPEIVMQTLGTNDLKVRYISPMSKAQKTTDIQSINYYVATMSSWAGNGFPQVLDNVDIDDAARLIADFSGVPNEILKDERAVAAQRKQRAEEAQNKAKQEQRAAGADQMASVGGAVRDISEAQQLRGEANAA